MRNYGFHFAGVMTNADKREQIMETASDHWPFEQWQEANDKYRTAFDCYAESTLGSGETHEDRICKMAKAIWEKVGYFEFDVTVTFLDQVPSDVLSMGEHHFEHLMGEPSKKTLHRRSRYECTACGVTRIAGQAFTAFVCVGCGEEKRYPNTAVPSYCRECCKKDSICCRCGGTMD